MADTKKTGINWFAWGIGIVGVYVFGFTYLIGPHNIFLFVTDQPNNLNAVGDFLAGVFAFPAFVLLATAVLTQRQELAETRDQLAEAKAVTDAQLLAINEQNTIALTAAKANYKVQVHDKRMVAYQRLVDVAGALAAEEKITKDTSQLIYQCSADAKFVFGDAVNEWIKEFIRRARELRSLENRLRAIEINPKSRQLLAIKRPVPKIPGMPHLEAVVERHMREEKEKQRVEEQDKLSDEINEKEHWFLLNLTVDKIDEMVGSGLKLPEDIG